MIINQNEVKDKLSRISLGSLSEAELGVDKIDHKDVGSGNAHLKNTEYIGAPENVLTIVLRECFRQDRGIERSKIVAYVLRRLGKAYVDYDDATLVEYYIGKEKDESSSGKVYEVQFPDNDERAADAPLIGLLTLREAGFGFRYNTASKQVEIQTPTLRRLSEQGATTLPDKERHPSVYRDMTGKWWYRIGEEAHSPMRANLLLRAKELVQAPPNIFARYDATSKKLSVKIFKGRNTIIKWNSALISTFDSIAACEMARENPRVEFAKMLIEDARKDKEFWADLISGDASRYVSVRCYIAPYEEWMERRDGKKVNLDHKVYGLAEAAIRTTGLGQWKRVLFPGSHHATVAVIVGDKGLGKDAMVIIFALDLSCYGSLGTVSFSKGMEEVYKKERGRTMCAIEEGFAQDKWTDNNAIKVYVIDPRCLFRGSYAEKATTHLRGCVLVMTSNDLNCIPSDGGTFRRWIPMEYLFDPEKDLDNVNVYKEIQEPYWIKNRKRVLTEWLVRYIKGVPVDGTHDMTAIPQTRAELARIFGDELINGDLCYEDNPLYMSGMTKDEKKEADKLSRQHSKKTPADEAIDEYIEHVNAVIAWHRQPETSEYDNVGERIWWCIAKDLLNYVKGEIKGTGKITMGDLEEMMHKRGYVSQIHGTPVKADGKAMQLEKGSRPVIFIRSTDAERIKAKGAFVKLGPSSETPVYAPQFFFLPLRDYVAAIGDGKAFAKYVKESSIGVPSRITSYHEIMDKYDPETDSIISVATGQPIGENKVEKKKADISQAYLSLRENDDDTDFPYGSNVQKNNGDQDND